MTHLNASDNAAEAGPVAASAVSQMTPLVCPECDTGRVHATFTYANGDTVDVLAECPACHGSGYVLASAVPRG